MFYRGTHFIGNEVPHSWRGLKLAALVGSLGLYGAFLAVRGSSTSQAAAASRSPVAAAVPAFELCARPPAFQTAVTSGQEWAQHVADDLECFMAGQLTEKPDQTVQFVPVADNPDAEQVIIIREVRVNGQLGHVMMSAVLSRANTGSDQTSGAPWVIGASVEVSTGKLPAEYPINASAPKTIASVTLQATQSGWRAGVGLSIAGSGDFRRYPTDPTNLTDTDRAYILGGANFILCDVNREGTVPSAVPGGVNVQRLDANCLLGANT